MPQADDETLDRLAKGFVLFCKEEGLSPAECIDVFASAIGMTIFLSSNVYSPEGLAAIGGVIEGTINEQIELQRMAH